MRKRDFYASLIIGAAVGMLSQPILTNTAGSFHIGLTAGLRVLAFVGFTVLAPAALFVLYLLSKAMASVIYQFGKFAAVGTLNTFVDIGVFNLEILLLGTPATAWMYRALKSVSFFAGTTNSFLWNKFWTFDSREPADTRQTLKFYVVAIVGFLLNVGTSSYVFSSISRPVSVSPNLWANVGALVGVAAAFIWDFLGYKFLVFKK